MPGIMAAARALLRDGLDLVGLRSPQSFALNQLDLRLLEYINFRRGIFVEAGANDGISQSNTLYFERYMGWRGLLIEPIPELAIRCAANRPRARVEQCALVPRAFANQYVTMTYCNLMSVVDGARGSTQADQYHLEAGRAFLRPDEELYKVDVPARSLSDVLAANRIDAIDLLSLDVEGFEESALMGLDFARHVPTWIVVEANNPSAVESVLLPRYELAAVLSNLDRLYRRI